MSGDKNSLPALRVEDEAVCVSPWREDGCGVWEALGHPVLRRQRLACCCRGIRFLLCLCVSMATIFLCLCRKIHPLQPQHAAQPACSGRRPPRLWQRLSDHCVWLHSGPTRWSVPSVCFFCTFWCYIWNVLGVFSPLKVKRFWKAARL